MAAVPGAPVTSATSNTTTNTSLSVALASTTVGDLNVITISGLATGTGINPTMATPAGWTKVREQMSNSGTPSTFVGIYWKFYQSGDGSAVTFTWANQGQMVASCEPFSNADTTTPVPYSNSIPHSSGAGTTYAITGTTGTDPGLLVYGGANKTGTAWSNLTDNDAGQRGLASSATMCQRITAAEVAGGAAYSKTMTGSASTIGVQWAYVVKGATTTAFTGAAAYTAGVALAATGTFTDGDSAVFPAGATLSASGSPVTAGAAGFPVGAVLTASAPTPIVHQLLTGGTQYAAHRNGTYATYGEETLEGYQAAYAQYPLALLEISVWDTIDGVYICSHDNSLSRVFGDSRTITMSTSNDLLTGRARPTTIIGGNQIRRIEEILDAFPTRLFIVENKHGTNQAGLSTLLDSHAPGRWMFKGPYNDTANANIAASHGAPMWLYFYPSQLGSLPTTYAAVSGSGVPVVVGLGDFSAAPVPVQADSDTFWPFVTSHGLMAWAHILGTTAQKSNADSQAAADGAAFNGYMISSFPTLAPVTGATGSAVFAPGVGLSAAGAPAVPGGVALAPGVSLAAGGVVRETGTVPLPVGITLTGAGAPRAAVGVAVAVGVALTAAGGPSAAVSVGVAVGALLSASGGPVVGGPVAYAAGALLAAAGVPAEVGAAAFSAGVQFDAAGSVLVAVAVGYQPGVTLAVAQAEAGTSGAVGLAAGVRLDVLAGSALGGAVGYLAGAVLAASGVGTQGDLAGYVAGAALAAAGLPGAGGPVGLTVGAVLSAAGGLVAAGSVVLLAGVVLDASGTASGVLVLFDGSLLGWRAGPARWAVREGVQAWRVVQGLARWQVRAWGDDVKAGDRRLVNLQVQSPRPLTDDGVAVTACVSQTRTVPDSPDEELVVIPDDYEWPGPVGWATVAAWVGPGLPVGTNYVLTHVVSGGEDFWDVARAIQVEE